MKKLSYIFLLVVALTGGSHAQNNPGRPEADGKTIPEAVIGKFKVDYPNVQPVWSMDGRNYRAEFTDASKGHAVAYDMAGITIYREEQSTTGSYPASIDNYFKSHSPNKKFEVWSSMDKSGMQSYYAKQGTEIFWFDKNGNMKNRSKSNP